MGSRADAVVVENGRVRIYFDKWAANHIDALVFWGLERTLEEFEEWYIAEEYGPGWNGDGLMDDVWAEGGCCVDLDRHHLLVYGDGGRDVLWIEAYLKLIRYAWPGWTVEWSWGEHTQMTKYLGVTGEALKEIDDWPLDVPTEEFARWCEDHLLDVPDYESVDFSTISAVRNGILRAAYFYDECPETPLLIGEHVEGVIEGMGTERLIHDGSYFPLGGVHLDFDRREAWLWRDSSTQVEIKLSGYWDGWKMRDLGHDYRAFYSHTPHIIDFVQHDEREYVHRIKEWMCRDVTCPRRMRGVDRAALFDEIERRYLSDNPAPVLVPSLGVAVPVSLGPTSARGREC